YPVNTRTNPRADAPDYPERPPGFHEQEDEQLKKLGLEDKNGLPKLPDQPVARVLAAARALPASPSPQVGGGGQPASVELEQTLDAQVPLDLTFRDETGKAVALRQYFGRKPLLMNLIQYRCTMLCSEEMKALGQTLKEMQFTVGDQFNVLTVSIDPRERPEL